MNINRIAQFAAAIAMAGALSACSTDDTDPNAPADDVATSEAPAEDSDAPAEEEEAPSDEATEEAPEDDATEDAPEDEMTPEESETPAG
jgi:hypothetical protein